MTHIINILSTQSVLAEYTPQEYEFYLAHKILEYPTVYAKARYNHAYKIVDCSACELGTGVNMNKVLKAARIVKASEIVLPDKVKSDDSLDMSLKALKRFDNKQLNEFKIAIVIQGSTTKKALEAVERLCQDHDAMVMIDTIMVPKWFSTAARVMITRHIQRFAPKKNIHWLGLGDDIANCVTEAKRLGIRSMDTGYFLSVAQNKMSNIFRLNRDKRVVIDLQHNSLKRWQIAEVCEAINAYDFHGINNHNEAVERIRDREFGSRLLTVAKILMLIMAIACIYAIFK